MLDGCGGATCEEGTLCAEVLESEKMWNQIYNLSFIRIVVTSLQSVMNEETELWNQVYNHTMEMIWRAGNLIFLVLFFVEGRSY